MWWWKGGGSVVYKEGDVTYVWSTCPVHRVPDPLSPGQQQPRTFTMVEEGTTVRNFTAAKLTLESACIFRLWSR